MKQKIIKMLAALMLSSILFSCQKEEGGKVMSIEEQYAYIDATGDEALSQIEPDDFQRLADLINSVSRDSLDIQLDEASQFNLALLMVVLMQTEGLVIDTDKINGTLTIDSQTASFKLGKSGDGKKVIYNTEDNTYTATIDVTKGSKKVKVGTYESGKDKNTDVYLILPTALSIDISDKDGLYGGGNLNNIDCSAMPDDWSELTPDKIEASLSAGLFLNGTGSYKAEANKLTIGNNRAELDGTLYGKEGKFLSSGRFSAGYSSDFVIDTTSISFYGNILDRITSRNNTSNNADIYLDGSATPQFTVNATNGNVTFADGTVKTFSEVFNSTNMPNTFQSGVVKIQQFVQIFGALL